MIWIIITLVVALILLLLDWGALRQRFGFLNTTVKKIARPAARPQSVNRRQAPATPVSAPVKPLASTTPQAPHFLDDAVMKAPDEVMSSPDSSLPEVQKLLSDADVHFRKGELKAAEQLYLQAAAKDPRCSKAYSRLGVIYLETGDDWQDAEEAFRQALKTDKNNGYILNNLGLVLYHQDRFTDAIRTFEQAVRLDELNANRHANLGKAYMAIRQYAKAESSFKKALKLDQNELEYKDLLDEALEKKRVHKTMVRR